MAVESIKRLATFMLLDWNDLGNTTLMRMYTMIRKLRPEVDETVAMEFLSKRTPLKFETFLQSAENLDLADNILEGDDRRDAKDSRHEGIKEKANILQLAEVALAVCKKDSGSKIIQAILKAADMVDASAPMPKAKLAKATAIKQVDPHVDDLRAHLPQVTGCRIQSVEARRVYYAEYPRDFPPRSHTKTWCATSEGLSRQRALFECWRWAWMAHQEKTGEKVPYSLEWAG